MRIFKNILSRTLERFQNYLIRRSASNDNASIEASLNRHRENLKMLKISTDLKLERRRQKLLDISEEIRANQLSQRLSDDSQDDGEFDA